MIHNYRAFILSIIIFIAIFTISLKMGTISMSLYEVVKLIFFHEGTNEARIILFTFRLPRAIIACLVGVCLSVSGDILQKITRNPIADSGILGVSSGVAFGATLYFFLLGTYKEYLTTIQSFSLMFFGLIGAIIALSLNLMLSIHARKLSMFRFILNGIGISSGFSSLVTFFSLKINADDFSQINNWLQGSISHVSWIKVEDMSIWVVPSLIILFTCYYKSGLLRFSDTHLETIGFSTNFWRLVFILLSAILICSSVLIAGTIGFVGLIVPPLTRLMFSGERRGYLSGLCLNGMSLLLLCDLFSRMIFAPNELPLNAVMGIVGIPYLFFLFFSQRGSKVHENTTS
ncbi:FecCD family ABC transporter permease [Melissococcus plutonius]